MFMGTRKMIWRRVLGLVLGMSMMMGLFSVAMPVEARADERVINIEAEFSFISVYEIKGSDPRIKYNEGTVFTNPTRFQAAASDYTYSLGGIYRPKITVNVVGDLQILLS